jgi:Na+/melibiose symporter-like transporter
MSEPVLDLERAKSGPAARMPLRTLLAYSFLEMPQVVAATPIALFLMPFYTQDLGLALAAVGNIMIATRIWDVVTDPAIGFLSDRTRSPIGRRRPWIVLGVPLMMLSIYRLFIPGGPVSNLYFLGWSFLLWFGWTMVNIPYFAWGAELSADYSERTRITTIRTISGQMGALLVIGVPAIRGQVFGQLQGSGEMLEFAALCALIGLPVAALLLVTRVPEAPASPSGIPLLAGLRIMWGNRPFRRLLFGFTISGMGPALQAPVYALFVQHVVQRPEVLALILPCFYLANLVGIGLWGWLAQRIEKHRVWMCGMGVMVTATPMYLFIGPGDVGGMMAILALSGIGAGSFSAVPTSMKADVIDLDTLESREDRAGVYFSTWSLAAKSAGVAGGFAYVILAWVGFSASGQNGPTELLALRIFFSGAPVLCYLSGLLIVRGYSITEESHARVRQELERRSASGR